MGNLKKSTFARGGLGRRAITVLSLFVLLVVASPYIIAKTPLLNAILGRIGIENDLRITAKSAEFGWFTPTSLQGLHMEGDQPPVKVQIESIQLGASWFNTWLMLPEIGQIVVASPQLELTLPESLPVESPVEAPGPEMPTRPIVGEFIVRDGSFRAFAPHSQEEVIRLDNFNLVARIESGIPGRTLTIEPVRLLDQVDLTPELCDHGLQLVAPLLANTTAVSGAASLELTECSIPLDLQDDRAAAEQATVVGTLQLHHVQTSMKDSIFRDVAVIVAGVLRVDLPDAMRIADDTEVRFELQRGRVHHEGLSFLLPEISEDMVWRTKGSVGLDETLDLVVQAQLPFTLAGDGPLARRLTERPIELHIGGTLDQPRLEPPREGNWLQEAASLVADGEVQSDIQPLADTVIELLNQARTRREENAETRGPTVLDRMRERMQNFREQRRQRFESDDHPGPPPRDDRGSVSL